MRGGARTIPMRLADRNPYQGFTRKISLVRGEGLVREFEFKIKLIVVNTLLMNTLVIKIILSI
jgi:hypothetical protein